MMHTEECSTCFKPCQICGMKTMVRWFFPRGKKEYAVCHKHVEEFASKWSRKK